MTTIQQKLAAMRAADRARIDAELETQAVQAAARAEREIDDVIARTGATPETDEMVLRAAGLADALRGVGLDTEAGQMIARLRARLSGDITDPERLGASAQSAPLGQVER